MGLGGLVELRPNRDEVLPGPDAIHVACHRVGRRRIDPREGRRTRGEIYLEKHGERV